MIGIAVTPALSADGSAWTNTPRGSTRIARGGSWFNDSFMRNVPFALHTVRRRAAPASDFAAPKLHD